MGKINYGRVVLGGIAAAVVFMATDWVGMMLLGFDWESWMQRHNLTEPPVAMMTIGYLITGILAAWLYAAIRPRFGAGAKTAVIAAIWLWLFYAAVYWGFTQMGMFSMSQLGLLGAWGIVQTILALLAAAWLYKEDGATA